MLARPFKVNYEQLGMTELPWATELTITLANAASLVLPVVALTLILVGVLALKRASPRSLNRMSAINFIVAVLMPGYIQFVVLMPIIELQKKLGGGS